MLGMRSSSHILLQTTKVILAELLDMYKAGNASSKQYVLSTDSCGGRVNFP